MRKNVLLICFRHVHWYSYLHVFSTPKSYPEVVGIHMKSLRVQNAQLDVGVIDVIHILHSSHEAVLHCDAMVDNFFIAHDSHCAV